MRMTVLVQRAASGTLVVTCCEIRRGPRRRINTISPHSQEVVSYKHFESFCVNGHTAFRLIATVSRDHNKASTVGDQACLHAAGSQSQERIKSLSTRP